MMRLYIFFTFLFFTMLTINAQTTEPALLTTSGNSFQNQIMYLDWSVGELAIETYNNASTVLTQGLHQPEIKVVTSLQDNLISISVYPNPASEFISLQTDYYKYPMLKTIIHDGAGRIMLENEIISRENLLDISSLKEGVYYLKIYSNGTTLKTTKLVKK